MHEHRSNPHGPTPLAFPPLNFHRRPQHPGHQPAHYLSTDRCVAEDMIQTQIKTK
jgi:hypothetical protein